MLRSLWMTFIYFFLLMAGIAAPFVATLGYVWVDAFQPQNVAYVILNALPVSLIIGIAAFGTYFLLDRKYPPPLNAQTMLQVAMAIWCTCTMMWAEAPDWAMEKWSWAFKTLVFAAFVPFVIRSRVQIEAFIQVFVFSLAANFIPFGIKVIISGGGYGMNLGLQLGNSGMSEGGLLSTMCLMTVPLAMFLARHNQLLPKLKIVPFGYWGMAVLAVVTALGTYERSALVGLVVLAGYMWMRSKHKLGFGIVVSIAAIVIVFSMSAKFDSRVLTISDYQQESSALGRILVWRWTLGYVATHPFGGGFNSYVIDHIEFPAEGGSPATIVFGKAFHSTYFEVLGEHGWVGLGIFLAVVAITYFRLYTLARRVRPIPELKWVADLADALQSGMAVFLTAGAFVSLGFQPMFWYFVALSVSLDAYVWRCLRQIGTEGARRPVWVTAAPAAIGSTPPPAPARIGSAPVGAAWRDRVQPQGGATESRPWARR